MDGPVGTALVATAVGFVVFFTCVFVFVSDPTRSFLAVVLIGIPLGLVISFAFWLFYEFIGKNMP